MSTEALVQSMVTRAGVQIAKYEPKSDVCVILDVIGILAIVAAVSVYVLLLSLVLLIISPLYFLPAKTKATPEMRPFLTT